VLAAGSQSLQASVFFRVFTEFAFDILSDSMHLAIRQFDRLGSGPILYPILGEAGPHGDSLPDIIAEIFSLGPAPLKCRQRNGFKRPRGHVAVGFLHIQVKIPVRVLPFETRECAREIHAFIRVEFRRKRMMRGWWDGRGQQTKNRHQNTGESALHEYLLEKTDSRNRLITNWDMLGVPYHT
jgi:hypothetical protein